MNKPLISIWKLLTADDSKVEEIVAELEAMRTAAGGENLWTQRLTTSTKGGKCG